VRFVLQIEVMESIQNPIQSLTISTELARKLFVAFVVALCLIRDYRMCLVCLIIFRLGVATDSTTENI